MSLATKTNAFNRALSFLGKQRLSSVDDQKESARLLKEIYDETLDYILQQHPWSFAKDTVELASSGTVSIHDGWDYKYALPVDFLVVVTLNNTQTESRGIVPHEIIGTELFCNEANAYLKYVKRETVLGKWSAKAYNALCYALARDVGKSLTDETGLLERIEIKADRELAEAKVMDDRNTVRYKAGKGQYPTHNARRASWYA